MSTLPLHAPTWRLFHDDPRFVAGALALAILCAPLLAALGIESRTYLGENVWVKPLKFALSLALFLATLAWAARYIPTPIRDSGAFAFYQWVVLACIVAEMVWIGGAATFATGSHFNVASPVMATIYGLMGVFAVTLTSATAVYGVLIWRYSDAPEASTIAISFIATFVATVVVAGYMAQGSGHHVGVEGADAARVWLMGWSREVGDLRVPHFFATHIMQFVPLAWFAIALVRTPSASVGVALTGVALAVTAATFLQAIRGAPLLPTTL